MKSVRRSWQKRKKEDKLKRRVKASQMTAMSVTAPDQDHIGEAQIITARRLSLPGDKFKKNGALWICASSYLFKTS
jgi:hypothetical protein